MKLLVGLGNPGAVYRNTRHNVGFQVLDAFAKAHHLSFSEKRGKARIARGSWSAPDGKIDLYLAKPQTYMNLSGQSVQALLSIYGISSAEVILIYDDLDLDCGRIRLREKGGSGGHRGVASVIECLGSQEFSRIKVGIGRDHSRDVADYVLSPFHADERELMRSGIAQALEALPFLIEGRMPEAMNRFHGVHEDKVKNGH